MCCVAGLAHLAVVWLPPHVAQHLRRQVGGRAHAAAGRRVEVLVLGATKVGQLDQRLHAAIKQRVLQLDVSVGHALCQAQSNTL